jgi:hypothetical protein
VLSFFLPSASTGTGVDWPEHVSKAVSELMGRTVRLMPCHGGAGASPASLFTPDPTIPATAFYYEDTKPVRVPVPPDAPLAGISFLTAKAHPVPLADLLAEVQNGVVTEAAGALAIVDEPDITPQRQAAFDKLCPTAFMRGRGLENMGRGLGVGIKATLSYTVRCSGNPNEVLAALLALVELHAALLLRNTLSSMLVMQLVRTGAMLARQYYHIKGPDYVGRHMRDVDDTLGIEDQADIVTGTLGRTPDEYAVAVSVAASASGATSSSVQYR